MNLVHLISSKAWFIARTEVQGYLPLVAKVLKGERVDFNQHDRPVTMIVGDGGTKRFDYLSDAVIPHGTIAIVPFRGVLTKDDQDCGPMGMENKGALVERLGSDANVSAIILDIDSPGGEASYMESLGQIILEAGRQKPVLAYFNGMAASAAYYVASGAKEIYASEKTDIVGSIGVMLTLVDMSAALEAEGIKLVEIYAPGSEDKNASYRAALEGDFEPIQKQLLTPYRDAFVGFVKAARPNISESVFSGKVYPASEAIGLGLVDGIKSFNQVVARAKELAAATNIQINQSNQTDQTDMKNIQKVVGREVNGSTVFSLEELQALDTALNGTNAAAENGAAKVDAMAEVLAKLEKMEQERAADKAENEALAARVEALANMPGADASRVRALDGDDEEESELKKEYRAKLKAAAQSDNLRY